MVTEDMFIRFDTIHKRDRRTDEHRTTASRSRHDKNRLILDRRVKT